MPHTGGITSRKNITLTVQETVLNKFLKINLIFMSSKLLSWDFQILKQCMSLNLTLKFKTVVFSYLWTLEYTSWPKEGIFHKKSCPVISDFTPLPSYIYDSSSSKNTHTHQCFQRLPKLSPEVKFFKVMFKICNESESESHICFFCLTVYGSISYLTWHPSRGSTIKKIF